MSDVHIQYYQEGSMLWYVYQNTFNYSSAWLSFLRQSSCIHSFLWNSQSLYSTEKQIQWDVPWHAWTIWLLLLTVIIAIFFSLRTRITQLGRSKLQHFLSSQWRSRIKCYFSFKGIYSVSSGLRNWIYGTTWRMWRTKTPSQEGVSRALASECSNLNTFNGRFGHANILEHSAKLFVDNFKVFLHHRVVAHKTRY